MFPLLCTWVLIIFSVVLCSVLGFEFTERLAAVLPPPDIEELYLRVRDYDEKQYNGEPRDMEDMIERKYLCRNIIDGSSIIRDGIRRRSVDEDISLLAFDQNSKQQLYNEFHEMLKQEGVKLDEPLQFPIKESTIHINGLEGGVKEYTFLCTYHITFFEEDYGRVYLSKEYDMNLTSDLRMPGRFIFRNGVKAAQKTLFTFAVVAANVIEDSQVNAENLYLESRRGKGITENAKDDPVCQLAQHIFTDICVSISNSSYFDNFETTSSGEKYAGCAQRDVHFKNHPDTLPRTEWMLQCNITKEEDENSRWSIFVLAGLNEDNFFVYLTNSHDRSEQFIANLTNNVVKYYVNMTNQKRDVKTDDRKT